MLSNIVQSVFIDPEWVATEYLRRCKAGAWKKENTVEALKCYNLEQILTASQYNLDTPDELRISQYIGSLDMGN